MTRVLTPLFACGLTAAFVAAAGCGSAGTTTQTTAKSHETAATDAKPADGKAGEEKGVAAERAKLSPEDRALVEAQEWCVESNERLGEMGPPIKLMVKGQPVFVCCDGCKKDALKDPDKTLAKVEELKKKKAEEKK